MSYIADIGLPKSAIDCSYCKRQLKLPDVMFTPLVRCMGCNTVTRVRHPFYPYLGGAMPYPISSKKSSDDQKESSTGSSRKQPRKDDDGKIIVRGDGNVIVSGNQVSGNKGDGNGQFSVGNNRNSGGANRKSGGANIDSGGARIWT